MQLHNEELHKFYFLSNIIRAIKPKGLMMEGHVVIMEEMINIYTILYRKPEGKRTLGRSRCSFIN
jgi:hypothetical protein